VPNANVKLLIVFDGLLVILAEFDLSVETLVALKKALFG
jgi:hypothetical protein